MTIVNLKNDSYHLCGVVSDLLKETIAATTIIYDLLCGDTARGTKAQRTLWLDKFTRRDNDHNMV